MVYGPVEPLAELADAHGVGELPPVNGTLAVCVACSLARPSGTAAGTLSSPSTAVTTPPSAAGTRGAVVFANSRRPPRSRKPRRLTEKACET